MPKSIAHIALIPNYEANGKAALKHIVQSRGLSKKFKWRMKYYLKTNRPIIMFELNPKTHFEFIKSLLIGNGDVNIGPDEYSYHALLGPDLGVVWFFKLDSLSVVNYHAELYKQHDKTIAKMMKQLHGGSDASCKLIEDIASRRHDGSSSLFHEQANADLIVKAEKIINDEYKITTDELTPAKTIISTGSLMSDLLGVARSAFSGHSQRTSLDDIVKATRKYKTVKIPKNKRRLY